MKDIAFTLAAIISATLIALFSLEKPTEPIYITHTVKSGDTLYDVCGNYASQYGDERSIQEIVFNVKKQNNIEAHIYPGEKIVIELMIAKAQ